MSRKIFLLCYLLPALYMAVPSMINIIYDITRGQVFTLLNGISILVILLAAIILAWRKPAFNRTLGLVFILPVGYMLLAILSDFHKSAHKETYASAFIVWGFTITICMLLLLTPQKKYQSSRFA